MTDTKRHTATRLILLAVLAAAIFVMCSTQEQAESNLSDEQQIREMLTEALWRWKYRDKAALYDLEFEYIQDRMSYDDYLEHRTIRRSNIDSLIDYKISGVTFFDRDSALVDDTLIFRSLTGKINKYVNKELVYFHRGRWIRPTLGKSWEQLDYEDLMRRADSAAAAEEEEGYDY